MMTLFEQREPYVWDHPVENLEPETKPADLVRDARCMAVLLLNDFAEEIRRALMDGGAQQALVRLYGISYGMGLNICGEVTMSDRADRLGVSKATLSKIGRAWNDAHDLPPSFHMKAATSIASYREARLAAVIASNNGNGANGTSE
jgi:hypothetical protein